MNENVAKLLNEQVNKEFYSAYLYLDFANYYAEVGLDGFENWYRVQAQEERDHAMLLFQYLLNNEVKVTFDAIAKPEWERNDNMTPLKKALEHEKYVTASINDIYTAAYEARDFRTMQLVCKRTGRRGKERVGYDYQNGIVRHRREGALYAQQRTESPCVRRTFACVVMSCFRWRRRLHHKRLV